MKINVKKAIKFARDINKRLEVPALMIIKQCTTFEECRIVWEDNESWCEGFEYYEMFEIWWIMKSKAKSFKHYEWLLERAYHNGLDDEWEVAMKKINKMATTFGHYKVIWVMEFVNHPKEDHRNWDETKKFIKKISRLAVKPGQKAWIKKNVW